MKIIQGYESEPMRKFEWNKQFHLRRQVKQDHPLVVFGCYHPKDEKVICEHKSEVIVIWMGKDTTMRKPLILPHVRHATWLPAVHKKFTDEGIDCMMLKVPAMENPKAVVLGNHIYAYLQKGKPEYHGSVTVADCEFEHPLLVGDHSIPRNLWHRSEKDKYYKKVFIGLALSKYVGGAMSIVEMGVRGIPVVTNVLRLPHCIPWECTCDIEEAVTAAAQNIGKRNTLLAKQVKESLAQDMFRFDLKKMLCR